MCYSRKTVKSFYNFVSFLLEQASLQWNYLVVGGIHLIHFMKPLNFIKGHTTYNISGAIELADANMYLVSLDVP